MIKNIIYGCFKIITALIIIALLIFIAIDGTYTNQRTECVTENNITTCKIKLDKVIEKWWWEK